MATSSRSSALSAINSLSSDGLVRLSTRDYAQFEALVQDYFNNDESDDDISGDDMEFGKELFPGMQVSNNHVETPKKWRKNNTRPPVPESLQTDEDELESSEEGD